MAFLNLHYYLFASFAAVCFGGEVYTITRSSTGFQPDTFRVPASKCSESGSECKTYYKAFSSGGNCQCVCPYVAGTFGYYNGAWTCLENTKVRQQTDCKFKFSKEYAGYPPKVLPVSSTHKVIPSGSCQSINFPASRYLNCDGTWTGLKNSSKPFTFLLRHDPTTSREYSLEVSKATHLAGSIVSLHFKCANSSQSSCLLFKIAGNITCPVRPVVLPSSKHHSIQSTLQYPLTTRKAFSVTSTRRSSTESPVLVRHRGSSPGTVSAVVVIVIIVLIIAALTGFIIWKRKRGENVWCKDQMTSIVKKFRPSLATSKNNEHGEPDVQIYAEIHEIPTQRDETATKTDNLTGGTHNFGFEDPNSRYALSKQQDEHFLHEEASSGMPNAASCNYENGHLARSDSPLYIVPDGHLQQTGMPNGASLNDEDGHLARSDSPLYVEPDGHLQQPASVKETHNYDNPQDISMMPEELATDDEGYLVPIDSFSYVRLKDPVERTASYEEDHDCDNSVKNHTGPMIPEEPATDDEGYLVPVDSLIYVTLKDTVERTASAEEAYNYDNPQSA